MNNIMPFFVEMLVASTLLFGGYTLLKKNASSTFKRYYMLVWIGCSVIFPLISFEVERAPITSVSTFIYDDNIPAFSQSAMGEEVRQPVFSAQSGEGKYIATSKPTSFNWHGLCLISYSLITVLFLLRIVISFYQIVKLKSNADQVVVDDSLCYEVQDNRFKGASFFNWIFIGKSIDDGRTIVVQHELAHSKMFHSVDILISHIYCAFFWINPFAWFLKREVGINCELEADAHLLRSEDKTHYANLLIDLSSNSLSTSIANHFSAFHLKSRIQAISNPVKHKQWVPFLFGLILLLAFVIVSCSKIDDTSEIGRIEKMNDVKSITTRFISHQPDTQEKTGKIIAIATFLPDGTLNELVEQTTYPYDFEFEKKKSFWDQPDTEMIPYVMDGLSLGTAEKNFLYGSDWPAAYAKSLILKNENMDGDHPLREEIEIDSEVLPTRIDRKRTEVFLNKSMSAGFNMPDIIECFEYEDGKVKNVYDERITRHTELVRYDNMSNSDSNDLLKQMKEDSGKKKLMEQYTYDGTLLTSIKAGVYEYKFYYEEALLTKSEYFKNDKLLNTRFHYYEDNLKDRTELYNIYNELEYTIDYEYEFWEN